MREGREREREKIEREKVGERERHELVAGISVALCASDHQRYLEKEQREEERDKGTFWRQLRLALEAIFVETGYKTNSGYTRTVRLDQVHLRTLGAREGEREGKEGRIFWLVCDLSAFGCRANGEQVNEI